MITQIKLQNFKAFGKFESEFKSLNLITGLNGMGKSTIIQALLLLRQSFHLQRLYNKGLFLNGDLVKIGKGIDAYWIHGNEDIISFEIEWSNADIFNCSFQYVADVDVLPVEQITPNEHVISGKSLFSNKFQYLSAERIGQKDTYPSSEYAISELNFLGVNGEYTTYFLERNFDRPLKTDALLHPNNQVNTLGAQINAWLSEISPGIRFIPESIDYSEIARQFYQFEYGDEKTRSFRTYNVGFGLNYVLPVLTAVLFASIGDIIIIENPEAHIHPKGQSKLGYLFAIAAKNGIQLLIETHSDHIINGARVAVKKHEISPEEVSIFYFNRDTRERSHNTQVHHLKLDKNGRLNKWPEGFLDEWDNMLDELI